MYKTPTLRVFAICFLIALSFCLSGQSPYIVTPKGDTLSGKFKANLKEGIHHEVRFQIDGQPADRLYLPADIRAFSHKRGTYYSSNYLRAASEVFTQGKYFLRLIARGGANVYRFNIRKRRSADRDDYDYLPAYLIAGKDRVEVITSNSAFRTLISRFACPQLAEAYDYEDYGIASFTADWLRCENTEDPVEILIGKRELVDRSLNWFVEGGAYMFNVSGYNLDRFDDTWSTSGSERLGFAAGASWNLSRRIELRLGVSYAAYEANSSTLTFRTGDRIDNTLFYTTRDTSLSGSYRHVTLGPELTGRYRIALGPGQVYGLVGFRYGFALSGQVTYVESGDVYTCRSEDFMPLRCNDPRTVTYDLEDPDSPGFETPGDIGQVILGTGYTLPIGPAEVYVECRVNARQFIVLNQTFRYGETGLVAGLTF